VAKFPAARMIPVQPARVVALFLEVVWQQHIQAILYFQPEAILFLQYSAYGSFAKTRWVISHLIIQNKIAFPLTCFLYRGRSQIRAVQEILKLHSSSYIKISDQFLFYTN